MRFRLLCFPCLPKVLRPADDMLDLAVAAISVMKMVRVRTCQLGELTGQVELHSKFEASGLEFLREDWDADFPSASLIAMTRFTAHMRNLAIALVPAAAQWCDCEFFCRPRTNRTRFLVVPWLTAAHQSRLHVQVIFHFVFFSSARKDISGLRPEIGLTVRTATKFQRYQVIQFVVVDAACDPIDPHQPVFHRIGVLEGWPNASRIPSPADRVSNVALSNLWIGCSWCQVVARQHSRRQLRFHRLPCGMVLANPKRLGQECSVFGRLLTPKVLAYEPPVVS
jgi:hypothetical protein